MASTGDTWRLGHRPALDGLRGVAILLVLADHTGFLPEPIGQVGVALFFTLSGFLITRVILERIEGGTWSYRTFLADRAVRLAPAFVLMVAVMSMLLLAQGAHAFDVAVVDLHALTYTQNMWSTLPLLSSPFAHAWSLAVEEQFYLVWPLLLTVAVARRRRLSGWLVAGMAGSLALHMFVTMAAVPANAWLPMQASGLLLGCLLAWRTPRTLERPRLLGWCAGATLLLLVVTAPALPVAEVTGAALANLIAAALIVASLHGGARLLTWSPLRALGRISYALYLWHYPLLVLSGTWYTRERALPVIFLALAVAMLSTLWVEEPVRRRWRGRTPVSGRPVMVPAVGSRSAG